MPRPSSMAFRRALLVAPLALLWQCSRVDYQPSPPDQATLSIHHLGAYSSQIGEDKEVQGTLFQTRWKLHWKKSGSGYAVARRLDTLQGKGYHKYSMPHELEKKIDLDFEIGSDGIPVKITGYDSLRAVFARLPQRESYRDQLLRLSDTALFRAAHRDAFRLRNMLPRGDLEMGTPLDVKGINGRLETLKLDSARYQGPSPRLERSCLEYEVYYHRTDSLALMVEMFFYSSSRHRKWKKSTWAPGAVDGIRHFSVERETGLPCFESITEFGHVTLNDPEEKTEQPITLYRYEEDIFALE
jgi:hypothetical protein